jgi:heme/copper-type cytochrome/quinol oxidase subunit 3
MTVSLHAFFLLECCILFHVLQILGSRCSTSVAPPPTDLSIFKLKNIYFFLLLASSITCMMQTNAGQCCSRP